MKTALQIVAFFFLCIFGSILSFGQQAGNLLPVSNKLLLNPSFAGRDKSSNLWSGLQYYVDPGQEAGHMFSFTFDYYSDKIKSGLAWYLYEGLNTSDNYNHTGGGFTWSKSVAEAKSGYIKAALNLNYFITTRQWYSYSLGKLNGNDANTLEATNKKFFQYNTFMPQIGLLWDSNDIQAGISFLKPFQYKNSLNSLKNENNELRSLIYISKSIKGKRQGLISKPYEASPEIAALLSDKNIFVRTGIRIELLKNNYGLFLQNNFEGDMHMHGLIALLGWNINNLKINITSGCLYSIPSNKVSFNGEAVIGVVIPHIHFSDNNPWKQVN